MKREVRVSDRVYAALYPQRLPTDPQSFGDHLNTNIVSEVRIETQRFYGGLETVEARYPGLNYTYAPHIKRLSYFPHHRRLFEVFEILGLTNGEILSLCRWEGTLWARQRYERDEGEKVRDTTGDEIRMWANEGTQEQRQRHARKASAAIQSRADAVHTPQRAASTSHGTTTSGLSSQSRPSIAQMLEQQIQRPQSGSQFVRVNRLPQPEQQRDTAMHEALQPITSFPIMTDESASSVSTSPSMPALERATPEVTIRSQRNSLNAMTTDALRRMRALAELRASGRDIDPSDPAFEQYLKEHAEASELPEGYEAAQTIANVMSTVQAMQSPSGAEVQGMDVL